MRQITLKLLNTTFMLNSKYMLSTKDEEFISTVLCFIEYWHVSLFSLPSLAVLQLLVQDETRVTF